MAVRQLSVCGGRCRSVVSVVRFPAEVDSEAVRFSSVFFSSALVSVHTNLDRLCPVMTRGRVAGDFTSL